MGSTSIIEDAASGNNASGSGRQAIDIDFGTLDKSESLDLDADVLWFL